MKSATKELLEELKPYAIPYAMRRFGNPRRDGGYGLIRKFVEECDCVYSYGLGEVAEQNIFDHQLAKLGKKVYLFDDKAEKPFIEHENIIYEKAFIDSSNAYEIILKNKHEKYKNILLQIDIEGSEYELFNNVDKRYFDHISHICIEFHDLTDPSEDKLETIKYLNKHYYIYHIHANNHDTKFDSEFGILPNILEICYIKKDLLDFKPYLCKMPRPINGIDKACKEESQDFLLTWWCD